MLRFIFHNKPMTGASMNEQTAVELLKIALDLSTFNASKFPEARINPETKEPYEKQGITLFNNCVKVVYEHYDQLVKNVGIKPPNE